MPTILRCTEMNKSKSFRSTSKRIKMNLHCIEPPTCFKKCAKVIFGDGEGQIPNHEFVCNDIRPRRQHLHAENQPALYLLSGMIPLSEAARANFASASAFLKASEAPTMIGIPISLCPVIPIALGIDSSW